MRDALIWLGGVAYVAVLVWAWRKAAQYEAEAARQEPFLADYEKIRGRALRATQRGGE